MEETTEVEKVTMPISEATDQLNKALEKIKNNSISPPSPNGYSHIVCSDNKFLTYGFASTLSVIPLVGFAPMLGFDTVGVAIAWLSILSTTASYGSLTDFMGWNGNPKNKIRSFLAKYIFTSKKKRLALKARQEEYKNYDELSEVFRLYVSDIRADLNERGVMDAINREDKTRFSFIDDNGKLSHTKVSQNLQLLNIERAESMLKELSVSPRIKEQLSLKVGK